ncbi:hypothetical protein Z517_01974 [Fonsecaea pedrosoi CBS 271.37]|uniref:Major facilitator superfamily (MFS) profile domain-containing protein n=1 Tax=Fonsecaea pedrosoi CBS 271.37 TaxID=1442368 RepID=A0A0D2E8Z5_9EURO|nr:uncharacterized protein Z517_01974 [Fonsecaea pedrosoi CBS 271.37]KIW86576.1 hypothetical protein Z517_01974 [Fonsecaea pedrosoi CBS 271.37]
MAETKPQEEIVQYDIKPHAQQSEFEHHGDHHITEKEQKAIDHQRSVALSADLAELGAQYFFSPPIVGTVISVASFVCGSYWMFIGPAAVLADIAADIGGTGNASLFSIVWSLCQPISLLLFGRLSDRFGRRYFVLGANLLSVLGGIVAATAHNMNQLIGANVLLGLGSGVAAAYPLLLGEIVPNKFKFWVVMIMNAFALPLDFSAYLSVRLLRIESWRWIYYIGIIINGLSISCFFLFYRPPTFTMLHSSERKRRDEIKHIDFLGLFLLIAGLCLFLLGVAWGGQPLPWQSPTILGLLISGFVGIVLFILWEMFSKVEYPIIPLRLFKDLRGFTCCAILSATSGTSYTALNIVWPSEVNTIYGADLTWQESGWLANIISLSNFVGIVILSPITTWHGKVKWKVLFGACWMAAFSGAVSVLKPDNLKTAIALMILTPITTGWLELASTLMVQYIVPDEDLGVGFAVVCAARNVAGSIFTAIYIAILSNKAAQKIPEYVIPAAQNAGLPASSIPALLTALGAGTAEALQSVKGMNNAILAAVTSATAYAQAAAYAYVYYAALAIGLVAVLAAVFLADMDQYLTGHVSRKVYHRKEISIDKKQLETGQS